MTDGLIELILMLVLFAIGFLVCKGIGAVISIDTSELDFDLIVLIGIGSLAVIVGIVYLVKRIVKKIIRNK